MKKPVVVAVAITVVALLGFSGCGGSGAGASSPAQSVVQKHVAASENDPASVSYQSMADHPAAYRGNPATAVVAKFRSKNAAGALVLSERIYIVQGGAVVGAADYQSAYGVDGNIISAGGSVPGAPPVKPATFRAIE